ncbi:hypothetical protein V3481_016776 [Fusarium oxysporum f. sp. vasinfectum]
MKTKDSRKKRYATKGKTGCITCRIRRVKCDEDKPSCHRCTSTGRKCDGYDLATLAPSGRLQLQPMVSGGSDPESQAIYQFRTRIATLIASSFDADFWTYDVKYYVTPCTLERWCKGYNQPKAESPRAKQLSTTITLFTHWINFVTFLLVASRIS